MTDKKGLKEIEKNPLQDYINFGVRSVDYAFFKVYKIEKYGKNGFIITKETINPIKTIEAGSWNLTEEDEKSFIEDYDFATVFY